MHPVKRPKAGDTEEDLIREEKEFLEGLKTGKVTPAATVIKKSERSDVSCKSNVGKNTGNLGGKNVKKDYENDDEADEGVGTIEHPVEAVLFDIKERPFDPQKLKDFGTMNGIPQVVKVQRVSDDRVPSSGTRKKSLFARNFDARKEAREKGSKSDQCSKVLKKGSCIAEQNVSTSNLGGETVVGDAIHPYLAGMTEEEILEEQRKLLERLDPKLVEFIKSRKNKCSSEGNITNQQSANQEFPSSSVPMDIAEDCKPSGLVVESDLPIDPKLVQTFPGMDKVELPKLEWAGVVKDGVKKNLEENIQSASTKARFDFSGMLLPEHSNDPTTFERALHNHGEEMERPGYTVDELLTLARSVNLQQRSIALETLGHIFHMAHTGIYDEVLEQSLFHLMDYIDLIHTARTGLDNLDSNTINTSLCCLASLLYPDLEEDCLDAVYLWPDSRPSPSLSTIPDELADDYAAHKEMKDYEFLQLDLLEFLITRSEILVRIEYLLTTKSELISEKGVTSLLKILIRLSRHSPSSVIKHEKVLKFVTENYISPNWFTLGEKVQALKGIPLKHALKLVRILAESSVSNAMKLYNNYSILPSVMSYLAYDQWREQTHVQEVESLILEAFKIWIVFLSFGIAIDEYLALFPVLMQFLTFYGLVSELNSFDLHHSSHLFALFTQILSFGHRNQRCQENKHSHWDLVKDAASLVERHCVKTLKILAAPNLQGTYSIDLALLSLGKGMEFLTFASKYCDKGSLQRQFQPILSEFTRSSTYSKMTANLITHSTILARPETKTRYPTNYASVGATQWKGHLHPIMRPNSPYHFLKYFLAFTRELCRESSREIAVDSNMESYLYKLRRNSNDCGDYFIRFELSCLLEILTLLPRDFKGKFVVSYSSLVFVPSCCDTLFRNLLRVALETCCNLNDVDAVFQFYSSYFLGETLVQPDSAEAGNLSKKTTKVKFDDSGHPGDGQEEEPKILFQRWSRKLTEAHWLFHPLENLYKRVSSTPGYVKDNLAVLEQETRGCLSFIHQCLQYHSEYILQTPQDLVTVYCRICRIFMLGTPSVYIDDATIPILREILKILLGSKVLKTSTKVVFSKLKPSSSAAVSFFDFYSELVNEYFDNSYFNEMFAAYLFLPLRTPEDERVKSCFWGHEYLNCLKSSSDKIPVPVEYITQHPEKDQKMLTIFTQLLKGKVVSKDRNPLLYEIISTHLKKSFEFMTDKLRNDFDALCI